VLDTPTTAKIAKKELQAQKFLLCNLCVVSFLLHTQRFVHMTTGVGQSELHILPSHSNQCKVHSTMPAPLTAPHRDTTESQNE